MWPMATITLLRQISPFMCLRPLKGNSEYYGKLLEPNPMKKAHTGKKTKRECKVVDLDLVEVGNEKYFRISNHDVMRPFFMSVVSDSNHWLFISSNGGLSAGRKNPEYALFPYYTDDIIAESADVTGSKTVLKLRSKGGINIWEPFSDKFTGKYSISRNLYKSIYGNKIIFEEINHDLQLQFRYQWSSSRIFGFVRNVWLTNLSDAPQEINILDGLQNILPYGVPSGLQRSASNLVDAYKRNELEPSSGLGIFSLSAIIVDRAEPSEALKANVVWSLGLENKIHLLSSLQLNRFRKGQKIIEECDVKGERGAYFVCSGMELPAKSEKKWKIIADVNLNHSAVIGLCKTIKEEQALSSLIEQDIDAGTKHLMQLVAGADGLLFSADAFNNARHFSNVLFNIMRGGVVNNHYLITRDDFVRYIFKANKTVFERNHDFLNSLDHAFSRPQLLALVQSTPDADLIRLATEYLPIKFSRRHGDPSRPWNYFNINIQDEADGSEILDYEGNWRDLFQNWEALAHSYPGFIEGMIFKFMNASTFDGYNPYRVTKDGFDWEIIEHDNPWSYIGYWGDHQIIYLLKFLEIIEKHQPGKLTTYMNRDWFVYAAIPYVIKPYDQILKNPRDTVAFDHKWDAAIRKNIDEIGADGALLKLDGEDIYRVNFMEKILVSVLAKISNLVPEAGIWLNTQRPEWNDANNALVGNGVSMVTLYHLYRFFRFFNSTIEASENENVPLSEELSWFYHNVKQTLSDFSPLLSANITDKDRKAFMDRMGMAASEYRQQIYSNGFTGRKTMTSIGGLKTFVSLCLEFIKHSIHANQRHDNLYHAYNLIEITENGVAVSHLDEMLEGQVAVLNSGCLDAAAALRVMDALRASRLFRQDQYSFILYPDKDLPGFLAKNMVSEEAVESSALFSALIADGNKDIIERDVLGGYHFNGNLKNAMDLEVALNNLPDEKYGKLLKNERNRVLDSFEKVFNHKAFTGRSGTFFAYEGLGSIYWHMVSKLLLAVQECTLLAVERREDTDVIQRLRDHYHEIEAGIGVHKSPLQYGAFPTDPYSHTPKHKGAQQPGMTGQVKEDILSRFGALGITVSDGRLGFNPCLLRKAEFLAGEQEFTYCRLDGELLKIRLVKDQLGFTVCQVPVVYTLGDTPSIRVVYADGNMNEFGGLMLGKDISRRIFDRTGEIDRLEVMIAL